MRAAPSWHTGSSAERVGSLPSPRGGTSAAGAGGRRGISPSLISGLDNDIVIGAEGETSRPRSASRDRLFLQRASTARSAGDTRGSCEPRVAALSTGFGSARRSSSTATATAAAAAAAAVRQPRRTCSAAAGERKTSVESPAYVTETRLGGR